jgi:hypothetical protein
MSDAASTTNPTLKPAPWPASTDRRGRLTWLLGLARKLIDYGKQLTAAIRTRGLSDRPAGAFASFGTVDLALILSRIAAALLRAEALEARLLRSAARRDPQPRQPAAPSHRAPRAADRRPNLPRRMIACPRLSRSPPMCVASLLESCCSTSVATSASRPTIRCGGS